MCRNISNKTKSEIIRLSEYQNRLNFKLRKQEYFIDISIEETYEGKLITKLIIQLGIPKNSYRPGYNGQFYTGMLPDIEFRICFYNRFACLFKCVYSMATEFERMK